MSPIHRIALLAMTTTAMACTSGKPTDTAAAGTVLDTGCDCPEPVTFYADLDADGYGDPDNTVQACAAPTGYVGNAADCDDTSAAVNPAAVELCDGVDNDCNGAIDDDATDDATWYADSDGDGFGDPTNATTSCSQPSDYVADDTDCDDGDASAYPGAPELCDGVQNACDSTWTTDDGLATWFDDDGSFTDLTATFAAGINGAPAAWSSTSSGLLQVCAGTWYLNVALSGDTVEVAGMGAPVLDGGQVGRVLELAAATSADVHDLTLSNGAADAGGGCLAASGGGSFTAERIEVTGCSAGGAGGGVDVVDASSVTLDTITLSANQAGTSGGGLRVETSASLAVTAANFTGNVSATAGGGASIDTTPASFDTVLFDANQTEGSGGGLYVVGAIATVSHGTVSSNIAGVSGGGLMCGSSTDSSLTLSDTLFEGNDATSQGGAIYASELCANVTGTDLEITGQSITGYGAAMSDFATSSDYERINVHDNDSRHVLYFRGNDKTITDSTISNNTSSEAVIYNDMATTIDLVNTEVSGNAAGNVGMIALYSGTLSCTGDTGIDTYGIWGNSAGWTGIVTLNSGSTFEAVDCDMGNGTTTPDNTATDIYIASSTNRYDYDDDATFTCSSSTGTCK